MSLFYYYEYSIIMFLQVAIGNYTCLALYRRETTQTSISLINLAKLALSVSIEKYPNSPLDQYLNYVLLSQSHIGYMNLYPQRYPIIVTNKGA